MNLTHLKGVFLLLISAAFSYYDVETDIRLALTYHKKGKCVKTLQSKSFRNLLDALLEPPRQFCKGSTYPYPLKLSTAWKSYHEQMWQQLMITLKNDDIHTIKFAMPNLVSIINIDITDCARLLISRRKIN